MIPRLAALCLSLTAFLLGACGYVHFGRIPRTDKAVSMENADLRVEKKILQQELSIARKEQGALRTALEARSEGRSDAVLAAKLEESTRALAQLRTEYAKLQAEAESRGAQAAEAPDSQLKMRLTETEDQLAVRLRELNDLRQEAQGLRDQLLAQKQENRILEQKVKDIETEGLRSRDALAQLNTELLAQKEARVRAEQASEAFKIQLRAVMAQEKAASAPVEKPTAVLSFSMARMGTQDNVSAAPPAVQAPAVQTPVAAVQITESSPPSASTPRRTHVVKPGETLESISRRYYGQPDRWRWIYAANNSLLRDGTPLRTGMELVIPGSSSEIPGVQ